MQDSMKIELVMTNFIKIVIRVISHFNMVMVGLQEGTMC